MFIFHPIPETKYQLLILPNHHLIHQRHKGVWIKIQAFFLLLQHPEENLNLPPAICLILLLDCNPSELIAGSHQSSIPGNEQIMNGIPFVWAYSCA